MFIVHLRFVSASLHLVSASHALAEVGSIFAYTVLHTRTPSRVRWLASQVELGALGLFSMFGQGWLGFGAFQG